ncbi:MAG: BON domain-containing protein [Myxococcota bacterium]
MEQRDRDDLETLTDDAGSSGASFAPSAPQTWNTLWEGPDPWRDDYGVVGAWPDRRPEESRSHAGKGPRGYAPDWSWLRDRVAEALTWDSQVDARGIEVTCVGGEITLTGTVADRGQKRRAGWVADRIADQVADADGVVDVHNRLRVGGF